MREVEVFRAIAPRDLDEFDFGRSDRRDGFRDRISDRRARRRVANVPSSAFALP